MGNTGRPDPALQERFAQGVEHLKAQRWSEAEEVYRGMLVRWPNVHEVLVNLGMALRSQRKLAEAVAVYHRALELRPHDAAEAWNNLGSTFKEMRRTEEAYKAFQQALALRPNYAEPYNGLAILLREAHQPAPAIENFRRAVTLRADFAVGWSNLATTLRDVGRLDESLACYERAITLQPGLPGTYSGRICAIHFHSAFDAPAIYRETRVWNERFARPLAGAIPIHQNDPSLQRRLRIGYVDANFREHCLSLFTGPLLSHHDHQGFEIICYSNVNDPDAVTARHQRHADAWRDISALTDAQVAQLILQDRIDILVDITMHMSGSRLGVFARKPAPVQVTWLGYPGTTGLDAIDYRLSDPRLDPSGATEDAASGPAANSPRIGIKEEYYSERTVCLPDSFWCYDPRGMESQEKAMMPEPGPLPALAAGRGGRITFGCLNNFCKVTDQTLELWAKVMAAVPDSRLILLASPGPHRELVARKLGVMPDRLEFVPIRPRRQYLETYQRIDLCLDTLPYNGHTTSLDSMWMGVPVITRVGNTVVGRAGLSQIHNLGLMELVTRTDEEFVRKAVEWAGDLDRLKGLRATLRQRMESSPLMDFPRFARNMEAIYRRMWRAWACAKVDGPNRTRSS